MSIVTKVATVFQCDVTPNLDPQYPAHLLLNFSSMQIDSMAENFHETGVGTVEHETVAAAYTALSEVLQRDILHTERGQWIAIGLLDYDPDLGHGAYYARVVE